MSIAGEVRDKRSQSLSAALAVQPTIETVSGYCEFTHTQSHSCPTNFTGLTQQRYLFERVMLFPRISVFLVVRNLCKKNIALAPLVLMALLSSHSYGQAAPRTPMAQSSSSIGEIDGPQARRLSTDSEHASELRNARSESCSLDTYRFPSAQARARDFWDGVFTVGTLIGPAITAGIDQARPLKVGYPPDGFIGPGEHPAHGSVPEWGEGFSGYSKRYASRLGMNLTGVGGRYAIGEALHEDTTYHPCTCTGIFPRAYHALSQTLIAHTPGGRSVPSIPTLVSGYGAAELATVAWYPSRYNASDALRTSYPVYINFAIKNLVKEFEHRH
jgi:hypothetical protein